MGIKIQSDGTYTVTFHKRHPLTNVPISRRRIKVSSKGEAQRVYNDLVVEVSEIFKREIVPTWRQVLDEYFIYLDSCDITRTTKYNREKLIEFNTGTYGELPVTEITTDLIRKIINDHMQGKSDSYRRFVLKGIRGVCNFAVERSYLQKNPTPVLKFKIKSKIKSVLTEEQIKILLRSAQEQEWPWYPHYSVALYTGLRNGELYALQWQNVDLEKKLIYVRKSWGMRDGFKDTKTGDDRVVEIPSPLLPLLRELKMRSTDSDFVLPRLSRWDRGEQAHDLRLFLRAIGLHEIRFHDLRASWATLLLNKDVGPSKVMAMGGWKNIQTMLIYMRKAGIDIRGSTDVLANLQTHGVTDSKVIQFKQS